MTVATTTRPTVVEPTASWWWFLPIAVALIAPKIPLASVGDVAIRPDDLLLFGFGVAALRYHRARRRVTRLDEAFFAWILIQVVAAIIGAASGHVAFGVSSRVPVRPVEYWLASRIALAARASAETIARPLTFAIYLNAGISCLQFLGILSSFSKVQGVRASALFNGPYELAAFPAGALFFFSARQERAPAVAALVALLLSAARITIVAVLVIAVVRAIDLRRVKGMTGMAAHVLLIWVIALSAVLGLSDTVLRGSFRERFSADIVGSAKYALHRANGSPTQGLTQEAYRHDTYTREQRYFAGLPRDIDPSTVIRVVRWSVLIRATTSDLATFWSGLGPSFAGVAVDGQFVRAFIEAGVFGLLLLMYFVVLALRIRNSSLHNYVIALAISALFIDVLVSFKPMILFWALYGIWLAQRGRDSTSAPELVS